MKIVHDTNKELKIVFDSVVDIQRYLESNDSKGFYEHKTHSHTNTADFSGTENWAEFVGIMENGSSEIIENIKDKAHIACALLDEKYELSHEYKFDVSGQFFDIGLVMSGEPESWLEPMEEDVRKQVEININASYLSEVDHSTVISNASRIVGMVLALEKMGVDTKINLNFRSNRIYSGNYGKHFMVSLVAKEYEQGVDYKKLSALLHTSMFRRGVFRMREIEVWDKLDNYGSTSPQEGDTLIDKSRSIDELERKLFGGMK